MKTALPLIALLLPALASADDCEFSDTRQLTPELQGVRQVRFEVNSHDLRLGPSGNAAPRIGVRACASDADILTELVVEQRRDGDTLVVLIERRGQSSGIFWSNSGHLEVEASLPAGLAYDVDVGSGDAWVNGLSSVTADVGSGDLELRGIAGKVRVEVGSGDIEIDDVGDLDVRSVGSGDLEARRVKGPARVGSVGSGDVLLAGIQGALDIGEIGSGDLDAADVQGNVQLGRLGSGDARLQRIAGDLVVRRVGSGDVSHSGVAGRVDIPED